jgi:NodT family efflux transporter outer membrane factor (OMF) lipoprotein
MKILSIIPLCFLLASCKVGPDYKKSTSVDTPINFKEGNISWSKAKPNDDIDRGQWWEIYNDIVLNDLMDKLNCKNQDIISAESSYKAALELVSQARASYLPSIGASYDITKQKEVKSGSANNTTIVSKTHSLGLTASWEIDLWGSVNYTVKSNLAAAQSSKANWALIKLSMQASLAQDYFELRAADMDQKYLDLVALAYKEIVSYTQNRYKAGIVDSTDVHNAENTYQTAQSAALNNQATRSQYKNAIAILVGESPSSFILPAININKDIDITIPVMIPSQLLERRPDIAKSEKLVAQANAQIGSAKAAFFPSLNLIATSAFQGSGLGNLLSMPTFVWSIGPQLALGLLDGGARAAQANYTHYNYESLVASYRQTVLAAFADVEDQLASLKSLKNQTIMQIKSADNANKILNHANNQYKAGIIDQASLLNSKINAYNANKAACDTIGLKRVTEINLIKALGGGWKE